MEYKPPIEINLEIENMINHQKQIYMAQMDEKLLFG